MFGTRAFAVHLIAVALSILQVRSVSVAFAPEVAPGIVAAAIGVSANAFTCFITRSLEVAMQPPGRDYVYLPYMPSFVAVSLAHIVVGADAGALTWDCWKPILHETSTAPSRGRLLTDILNDPVISDVRVGNYSLYVRNRWNESWRIDPVVLPWGQMAAHATLSSSAATLTL
eukprot:TRINITY_DN3515_c0_g2_i1.p1 TRINITY_DN3515_c0_g2~~TRINITY_DN3515_c0_g2_i1.p1  ORF type:complete len:172 (+),score=14.54 TRINITY_DN3515_c0_g2_i1:48-563(+)